jgi:hypothetical protein
MTEEPYQKSVPADLLLVKLTRSAPNVTHKPVLGKRLPCPTEGERQGPLHIQR